MARRQLAAFIAASAERRFEPGAWDCGLWLADWVAVQTGHDPAAHLRGIDAALWNRAAQRLPVVVGRLMRRDGKSPVKASEARPGDIGVLRIEGRFTGGICTGIGWAILSDRGVVCSRALSGMVVRAWRIDGDLCR